MARKLKVSVVVLNVRIHPHSEDNYAAMLQAAYTQKRPIQIHGDRYGLISTLNANRREIGFIDGVFTTFTKVDLEGEWFDIEELDEASTDKLKEISIPDGIFPNTAAYYFSFNLNTHKLYVETYSSGKALTATSALRFIKNMLTTPDIAGVFGEPSISLVQAQAGLDKLFSIDRIKEITVTIEKPNADIFSDDFEEEIEKHLLETHSQSMTINHKAVNGQSIVPNDEVKQISSAALQNGEVRVTGRDEGVAVNLSSKDFPKSCKLNMTQTSLRGNKYLIDL
jgi:hypothetical protein